MGVYTVMSGSQESCFIRPDSSRGNAHMHASMFQHWQPSSDRPLGTVVTALTQQGGFAAALSGDRMGNLEQGSAQIAELRLKETGCECAEHNLWGGHPMCISDSLPQKGSTIGGASVCGNANCCLLPWEFAPSFGQGHILWAPSPSEAR